MLAAPLNIQVLRALESGSRSLMELRRAIGAPPQTTLRMHLRELSQTGVLDRRQENVFPGAVAYALTTAGKQLVETSYRLEHWLAGAPDAPIPLGSPVAKSAIKALVDAWNSTIVRAIAAMPLSLTELNKLISSLNYPSLERRIAALRLAGLIEAQPAARRGTPYGASDWLRRAVGPLTSAAAWEREYLRDVTPPLSRVDMETVFLLAVPSLQLDDGLSGVCRLAAEARGGNGRVPAGVTVRVAQGRILSCVARLEGDADGWATGTASAWLDAVVGDSSRSLEIGGDAAVPAALCEALKREFALTMRDIPGVSTPGEAGPLLDRRVP